MKVASISDCLVMRKPDHCCWNKPAHNPGLQMAAWVGELLPILLGLITGTLALMLQVITITITTTTTTTTITLMLQVIMTMTMTMTVTITITQVVTIVLVETQREEGKRVKRRRVAHFLISSLGLPNITLFMLCVCIDCGKFIL